MSVRGRATTVSDPTGAARDPALPTLPMALDPAEATQELARALDPGPFELEHIEVLRHKPGRRCLVEYRLRLEQQGESATMSVLGKVRVRRYGKSGHRRLKAFWDAGFSEDASDGVSVPEPVGTIGAFRMWLQRKVPGIPVTELLPTAAGVELGARVAECANKIHRAGVTTDAAHRMDDELRILHEHLPQVTTWHPQLEKRVTRILEACVQRAGSAPQPEPCGIHRDFYADQLLLDGERLRLLDLDLYCLGDPGLDPGNFLGHITEQAIREHGDPHALSPVEQSLRERFATLAGNRAAQAMEVYADLTLVRHIYLSAVRPERRAFTPAILEVCESRLLGRRGVHPPDS